MPKLILASNSPQRKKLLRLLGVKFSVFPSRVTEIKRIKTTCADLVKHNALLKAKDVAARIRDGLVIGADTIVYVGHKKIIGKPRHLKDAKKILKVLFSRPHWVYTGVAIVDAKNGKTMIDYEKTKVFMTPLSDEEIDRYHKLVSPLDKAGGFDIEGWGSTFIRRIEGCYSNVIGLPMAKLSKMIKKMGVSILSLLFLFTAGGCVSEYNLATQKQERLMYDTDKEVQIGDAVAQQVQKKYKVVTDVDVNERAQSVLDKIVEVCDRKDIVYFIKVIEDEEETFNAVSLPGGYVYIFKALYDILDTDDQLAGVVAHEVGHITAKHSIKKLQEAYGYTLLQLAASQTNAQVFQATSLALTTLFFEHSQEAEFEADRLGVKYMKKAGYDSSQMVQVLQKLKAAGAKEAPRPYSYWRSHPHLTQRISFVNKEIQGKLEFKDYLNLIE